jgi:hypothetical protein
LKKTVFDHKHSKRYDHFVDPREMEAAIGDMKNGYTTTLKHIISSIYPATVIRCNVVFPGTSHGHFC